MNIEDLKEKAKEYCENHPKKFDHPLTVLDVVVGFAESQIKPLQEENERLRELLKEAGDLLNTIPYSEEVYPQAEYELNKRMCYTKIQQALNK